MAKQLAAIPLSTLDEVKTPDNFWIFGSEEFPNGTIESRKYKLENLVEYAKQLQFERRISINMEADTHTMFIGEEMTIYRVETENISSLKINDIEVKPGKNITLKIPACTLVSFIAPRTSTDPVGYIFVFARAKAIG